MCELRAGHDAEHFTSQMVRRTDPGRAVGEPRLRFGKRDEIL